MEFKTLVGAFDALNLGRHLGIGELGQETDRNTKVVFKHVEKDGYHFIEISMEI